MRDSLGSGQREAMLLPEALTQLYAACANYPKPASFDDSYGPLDPEVAARVLNSPLTSVSPEDASPLFEVLLDDETAFAHFFPRLVELAVNFEAPFHFPDLPAVVERARRQRLLVVPEVRRATHNLGDALWEVLFATSLASESIENIVRASAWIADSLQLRLDGWSTTDHPSGQDNLSAYILYNLDSIRSRRRLRNDREWDDRPQHESEISLWLRSTDLMTRICQVARSTGEPGPIEACAGLRDLHTAPSFP